MVRMRSGRGDESHGKLATLPVHWPYNERYLGNDASIHLDHLDVGQVLVVVYKWIVGEDILVLLGAKDQIDQGYKFWKIRLGTGAWIIDGRCSDVIL